jgi:2OG-Fe(II) oxygenase superfamily
MEDIFALAATEAGGLVAEEIEEGIYLIKNALSSEEIVYLRNLCDSATEEDWAKSYIKELTAQGVDIYGDNEAEIKAYIERNYNPYWADKVLPVDNDGFCKKIVDRIRPFFGDKYDLQELSELQRQKPGEGLDEHHDGGYDTRLLRAIIFYVNEDFEDGELYFPKLDFQYKPKAGDFITFPSSEKYLHGVKAVGPGPSRYALAGFAWAAGTIQLWTKDH